MGPKFIAKTTLDLAACKALTKVNMRKIWVQSLCAALGFGLFTLVDLLWLHLDITMITGSFAVFFVIFPFVLASMMPKAMLRNAAALGREVTYSFGDDAIHVVSSKEDGMVKYDAVVRLAETDGHFLLYRTKDQANVIAKDSFVQGGAGSFMAFMEQKTGLVAKKY